MVGLGAEQPVRPRGKTTLELGHSQLKEKTFSTWTVQLTERVNRVVHLLRLMCSVGRLEAKEPANVGVPVRHRK